jgi:hypothetical protein
MDLLIAGLFFTKRSRGLMQKNAARAEAALSI